MKDFYADKIQFIRKRFQPKKEKPTPDGVGKIAMKKKVMFNITSTNVCFNFNSTTFSR